MRESKLWEWLLVVVPAGHYSRVESGDTSPGFPDVDWQIGTRDHSFSGKFELKFAHKGQTTIPFKSDDEGLHRSQRLWFREHLKYGGKNSWIIAEITREEILVIPGKYYHRFNGATIEELREISTVTLSRKEPRLSAKKLLRIMTQEEKPSEAR